MGIMIRNNKDIKGVYIQGKEYKLFQYADDTGLILDGTEKSLLSALHLLDQFSKYSGLTPNLDKTKCIWLGSKKDSQEILCIEKNLSWTNEPFVLLGIKFSTRIEEIPEINFESKMCDVKKMISIWSRRQLSPLGKIVVVKSLILPKLTHLFISLPEPSHVWLKQLETMLFHFIWNHNIDRIARCQLIQDYSLGGLRMVHIGSFIKSMKLSWIQRLILNDNTCTSWSNLYECLLPEGLREPFFNFGNEYLTQISRQTTNMFWKEVFKNLIEFRTLFDTEERELINSPIWYNNKIKIGGECVYYKDWYQKGIFYISDFLNQDGKFMSYDDFSRTYNFRPMVIRFLGLKCAILTAYPWLRAVNPIPTRPVCPKYLYSILNNGKRGKKMYDFFIEAQQKEQKFKLTWTMKLNLQNDNKYWKQINLTVKLPMEVKLQWFQYRIIHRILGTNSLLHKIGIAESPLCSLCTQKPETILHLFWECPIVSCLISEITIWFSDLYGTEIEITASDFILGKPQTKHYILNVALIILKYYIYKQKFKKSRPNFMGFKRDLESYYKFEQLIYKKNCKRDKFQKRWEHFYEYLENN